MSFVVELEGANFFAIAVTPSYSPVDLRDSLDVAAANYAGTLQASVVRIDPGAHSGRLSR